MFRRYLIRFRMNESSHDDVKRIMQQVRKSKSMPSSETIVAETFEKLGFVKGTRTHVDILTDFDGMLRKLWEETLITLEFYEEKTYSTGIPEGFINAYPDDVMKSEVIARERGFSAGVVHLL